MYIDNKRRFWGSITLTVTFILMFLFSSVSAFAAEPPWVVADSAVIIDGTTGQVIYSKNMNTSYPPASTTKVMTALLAFENCDLDEIVTVPKEAVGIEGSKIWILEDEKISVRNMLYALMMESANDCATALAIHIGGTEENFIKMMNDKVAELGLKNTHFMNPHGLYNSKHKTSAYDLSKIMMELVKYPEYIKISKTQGYRMPATSKAPEGRPLWNGNKLVLAGYRYYAPIEAGKTGYTIQSLFSYVASAQKDGNRYIVALVHDSQKNYYTDSVKLFKYAFNNFKREKLFSQGDVVTTYKSEGIEMPLLAADDVYITVPNETDLSDINIVVNELDDSKSYKAEEFVSTASLSTGNVSISADLIAAKSYLPLKVKKTFLLGEIDTAANYSKTPFVVVILIIMASIIIVRIFQVRKKRKRRNLY